MRLATLLFLTLVACRDRRPPPPPCEDVNREATASCSIPTPLTCETADEEHIRCVDEALKSETSCALVRQAVTVCLVKHGVN